MRLLCGVGPSGAVYCVWTWTYFGPLIAIRSFNELWRFLLAIYIYHHVVICSNDVSGQCHTHIPHATARFFIRNLTRTGVVKERGRIDI